MSVLLVLRDSLQFAASCKIKWFDGRRRSPRIVPCGCLLLAI
jgi:hypothetical protein